MASEAQPRSPLADGPDPLDAGEHEGAERQMDLCADGERSKHGLGSVSGAAQAIREHISGTQAREGNIPARELRARTMASTHLTRLLETLEARAVLRLHQPSHSLRTHSPASQHR